MVRIVSELCDCGRKKSSIKGGKRKENKQMRTGREVGDEGARMISESLKINTTLTKLSLYDEDKIMKKEIVIGRKSEEIDNEQVTKLEPKELR